MAIKLTDLEKRHSNPNFIEVELSTGNFRIYQVPQAIIWMLRPDWEPGDQPTIEMKVAGGAIQRRLARPGDDGYSEWQNQQTRYIRESAEIRYAARFVYGFRDQVEYPKDLTRPPDSVSYAKISYPGKSPDDLLRKFFWLATLVMPDGVDFNKVDEALASLRNDIDPNDVDEVKKNSESTTEGRGSEKEAT